MITFAQIQTEFRQESNWLLEQPLSRATRLLRSLVGPEADPRKLEDAGWRLLHVATDGTWAGLWQRSLWFEKTFGEGDDARTFQLGTSRFFVPAGGDVEKARPFIDDGTPFARARRGETPAGVFVRELLIRQETAGGLSTEPAAAYMPDDVLRQVRRELRSCLSGPPATFLGDLAFQTYGMELPTEGSTPESEFRERLARLSDIVHSQPPDESRPAVSRLLLPLATALRGKATTEKRALLDSFADFDLAFRLLVPASHCPEHPEIERYIGAWVLRMASELPESAIEARHWEDLAILCLRKGCPLAAVYAADRALSSAPDPSEAADRLARAVLLFFHSIPLNAGDAPRGLPDVIEILMRNESVLQNVSAWSSRAYWSLLGLALRLNGNSSGVVSSTLERALRPDGGETDDDDRRCRAVAEPLEWQSFLCGAVAEWAGWAVRQLRTFPTPVLGNREDSPWQVPTRYDEPPPPELLWRGLVPDMAARCSDLCNRSKSLGTPWLLKKNRIDGMPGTPGVWNVTIPQITDATALRAIRAFRWFEEGKELGILSTWASDPDHPEEEPVCLGMYPIANHYHEANAVVSTWEWFPYAGNEGGEARIRLPDGRPLRAVIPLFVGDRQTVERAIPRRCYFSAVGIDIAPATGDAGKDVPSRVARARRSKGLPIDGPMLYMGRLDKGAVCFLRGPVRDVRTVGLSGCPDVLRLEMDVGLPFPLPVYVRARKADEPAFSVGALACGHANLLVDYFNADDVSEAFFDAHPWGDVSEPEWRDPARKVEAPRMLPKRDPNDPERELTPEDFKFLNLAELRLGERYGHDNVVRWDPNPHGVDFAVRAENGSVVRYSVFRREGETSDPPFVPEGCQGLVVRFRDGGDDRWNVEYEEM